tara:strand:- start:2876 stop:3424 length:549 start_codon:yes stop_codon:yes gene_type:complete
MICHDTKYIFVHIPKTAGKSITKGIGGNIQQNKRHLFPKDYDHKLWSKYFTFTCVRHPLDRLVSWYFFMRKRFKEGSISDSSILANDNTFKQFVELHLDKRWTIQPQVNWFDENYKYNYVMKIESIEKDFSKVCEALSIKSKLPFINKSDRKKNYISYYDSETLDIAYNFYINDFQKLEYSI